MAAQLWIDRRSSGFRGWVLLLFLSLPASTKATICIKSPDWSQVAEARTDDEGRFLIPGVRPGLYTLRWDLEGFQPGEISLRVRRFVLRRRARLVLVMDSDVFGCGGWVEMRRGDDPPK